MLRRCGITELSGYDGVKTLRGGDVLWQKERLLAVEMDELIRRGADGALWFDADVMVLDSHWARKCRQSPQRAAVCQVFSTVCREKAARQI